MAVYYIGADVHSNNTELAVERQGRIVQRHSLATTVQAIRQVLEKLNGAKHLAIEEGPLAGWLSRNLVDHVDTLVVCDPRRNKSIACDGDKDDRIDAAKLAGLLRGNYLRVVHHSRDEQMVHLKRWVRLYEDRVRDATRTINKIRGCARQYGQRVGRRALHDAKARDEWFASLACADLAEQLRVLFKGYDVIVEQVELCREHPTQLQLVWPVNKRIKNVVIGATISAIYSRDNGFRQDYERMVSHGTLVSNARHAVARRLLTVLWGMWKNHRRFDPSLCWADER